MQKHIDQLAQLLAKIPGLGPRSARRAVLYMLKHKERTLMPIINQMTSVAENVQTCRICGNLDETNPCDICTHPTRDAHSLCVVTDVADLWAIERAQVFKGRYHVLGGVLSAIDGVGPESLRIHELLERLQSNNNITEVILALSATLDGQVTMHYIQKALSHMPLHISVLSHGVPMGGELDYLDDGTINAAFGARRQLA